MANIIYRIEPGDWEQATGDCVDDDVFVQIVDIREITLEVLLEAGFSQGARGAWSIASSRVSLSVAVVDGVRIWSINGTAMKKADGPKNVSDLKQLLRILGL